ncbi:hypothetical protein [Litorisediminicola beolgyonensis]|uniref:Uncharacterized protein n=1 Tax=Litorisediminicola beolgyonensis TaxID=1173614 RepID=A0ABW3ZE35_9RHOB
MTNESEFNESELEGQLSAYLRELFRSNSGKKGPDRVAVSSAQVRRDLGVVSTVSEKRIKKLLMDEMTPLDEAVLNPGSEPNTLIIIDFKLPRPKPKRAKKSG